jgi:hypothetical protein
LEVAAGQVEEAADLGCAEGDEGFLSGVAFTLRLTVVFVLV